MRSAADWSQIVEPCGGGFIIWFCLSVTEQNNIWATSSTTDVKVRSHRAKVRTESNVPFNWSLTVFIAGIIGNLAIWPVIYITSKIYSQKPQYCVRQCLFPKTKSTITYSKLPFLAIIGKQVWRGLNVNLWMGYSKQIFIDSWWWLDLY